MTVRMSSVFVVVLSIILYALTSRLSLAQSCGTSWYLAGAKRSAHCPSSPASCLYPPPPCTYTYTDSSCASSSGTCYAVPYVEECKYSSCDPKSNTYPCTTDAGPLEGSTGAVACTACPYYSWTDYSGCGDATCGSFSCAPNEMCQRRTSSHSVCRAQYRCVASATCSADPKPTDTPTPTPTPTPTNTPTPTPTGTPVTPFFKVKNTSFYKYGNLTLTYPTTLTAFDADDTTSSAFNQGGNGGVTLAQGSISLTNATITSPDWRRENVSSGTFNASSFVAYVKSKKTYTAINTNLNGVTTANTTYLYTGDLTLTQSSFPTSTIPSGTVLLVEGNVTVGAAGQTTLNTTANTPFALIVTGTLTFADATTQVNGLYAASTVNFGTGAVPLKIVGNVVSGSSSVITRQRTSAPLNAPSLFVVFDPTHYVTLVDKISITKSDYQQVQ